MGSNLESSVQTWEQFRAVATPLLWPNRSNAEPSQSKPCQTYHKQAAVLRTKSCAGFTTQAASVTTGTFQPEFAFMHFDTSSRLTSGLLGSWWLWHLQAGWWDLWSSVPNARTW